MSQLDFLFDRFASLPDQVALVLRGEKMTYGGLLSSVRKNMDWLRRQGVGAGAPVVLLGDYSPLSVGMLLALIETCCIVVPLTPKAHETLGDTVGDVEPAFLIDVTGGEPALIPMSPARTPDLYAIVTGRHAPGLVLFTSGSSGKPKAVVHDFSRLIAKFRTPRPAMVTLNFLLFDHWGGLNTLLHCLSNLCLTVMPESRTPDHVCELIEEYGIELLPTTPSFLNMLLISKAYAGKNLSTLRLITYGAEPMPSSTLDNLRKVFPDIEARQTYGMIELGVLRAKSRSPDSLWMKMGGEGYDLRVVDGILQIKAESAMLGYINAPSPFTEDGYLITGDLVEVDGEWMRVLGRQSDIINVGGQKVYPAEVEAVLLAVPGVLDAVVYGEANVILGKIVCASIVLDEGHDEAGVRKSAMSDCRQNLQSFMVPMKIRFVDEIPNSPRLKRIRSAN